jgi:predicted enzyme related to lactoylglutathione lyase
LNALACRDIEAAKRFYGHVFGWGGNTQQMGPMTYTEWKLGDKSIGGMARMDENWPAEVPPHWMVYFSVDDCDAAVAKVAELGGTVSVPPLDIPPGRFSVVNDPHGAVFSVIKLAPQLAGM